MKTTRELRERFAGLFAAWEADAARVREELLPAYSEYVREVSEADMAMSMEAAVFLLLFCRAEKPQRVADLGSGFSSYVLRLYRDEADEGVETFSADDHPGWLEKTREFLRSRGQDDSGVMHWDDFRTTVKEKQLGFDLIFHDLGDMATRRGAFDDVLKMTRKGLCIVDDMHKSRSGFFIDAAHQQARPVYTLRDYTLDQYGRWAALVDSKSSGR